MSDDKIYDIPAEWKQRGYISESKYQEMYQRSVADPNGFWGRGFGWFGGGNRAFSPPSFWQAPQYQQPAQQPGDHNDAERIRRAGKGSHGNTQGGSAFKRRI